MTDALSKIQSFVAYARSLKGDEKGEAQVFCDRLFQAFGHDGYKEAGATLEYRVKRKGKSTDRALPLDNLDQNIICDDALFYNWEPVDAIIGNPPYQSKNKMQKEFGIAYVQKMRSKYDAVPGWADYCVYWFRRAHDELKPNGRAGATNSSTSSRRRKNQRSISRRSRVIHPAQRQRMEPN